MSRVVIIGSGPAGISASLYCVRAGLDTTVVSLHESVLDSTDRIENYYGFPDGVGGKELALNGINQALKLGVKIVEDEVFSISYKDNAFIIGSKNGSYEADGIVIATGSKRNAPKIKGIKELDGRGVSYCAVCDAFFFRNKDVAVLGTGDYALHEINDLLPLVKSVTLVTNGVDEYTRPPENVKVITDKITEVSGEDRVDGILFENGGSLSVQGVFIALGTAGSTALARKAGAATQANHIKTDENMKTSVKRIYAAGDCTGGLLQISKAVYEGAKAATELIKELRKG